MSKELEKLFSEVDANLSSTAIEETPEATEESIQVPEPTEEDVGESIIEDENNPEETGEESNEELVEAKERKPDLNMARERISAKKRAEEAEARARALEIENAKLLGAKEVLQQKPIEQPKQEAPIDPEPELGTYEHDVWVSRQALAEAKAAKEYAKEVEAKLAFSEAEKVWKAVDSAIAESNPAYKASMDFLRNKVRSELEAIYPAANKAVINDMLTKVEYAHVAKAKNITGDEAGIEAYFLGQAFKEGFNPYADIAPKLVKQPPAQPAKPTTDKAEVNFHKRNNASVVASPAGEAYKGISLRDTGRMSLAQLMQTMSNDADFSQLKEEAIRKDSRGDWAF